MDYYRKRRQRRIFSSGRSRRRTNARAAYWAVGLSASENERESRRSRILKEKDSIPQFGFNAVRISYADTPDMAEINDFFEACGMRRMESKQDFLWRIPVNGLSVFAAKAPGSMDKRLIAAETLGGRYLRAFEELVQQNHEILLPKDAYDDTLSLAFFDDESRCAAGMLVKKGVSSAEARLLLSEDASLAMVKAMLLRLIEAKRETPFSLLIPVTNREVKDMISFFADAKAISAYRLNTWYMAL